MVPKHENGSFTIAIMKACLFTGFSKNNIIQLREVYGWYVAMVLFGKTGVDESQPHTTTKSRV